MIKKILHGMQRGCLLALAIFLSAAIWLQPAPATASFSDPDVIVFEYWYGGPNVSFGVLATKSDIVGFMVGNSNPLSAWVDYSVANPPPSGWSGAIATKTGSQWEAGNGEDLSWVPSSLMGSYTKAFLFTAYNGAGYNDPLIAYMTNYGFFGAGTPGSDFVAHSQLDGGIGGHTTSTPIPIPPAVWLFASGLIGLVGIRRRFKK